MLESIALEEAYLKDTLMTKLRSIQEEKDMLMREIDSEETERVVQLQRIIERILTEKNRLEELLS